MKRVCSDHKRNRMIAILAAVFFTIGISSFIVIHINSRKNTPNPIQQTSKSLKFLTTSTHLGLVPVGSDQKVSFKCRNVTDKEIRIDSVKSSCACIADVIYPKDAIMPGEESTIDIDYRVGEGKKKYALLAELSSGESQVLTVSSEGYYDVRLSAEKIEFSPVAQNTGGKMSIVFYGDREIFDINSIMIPTDTPDWLHLRITEIEDSVVESPFALNSYRDARMCPVATIELLLKAGAPMGRFFENFTFDVVSEAGDKRELILKCVGEIVAEVSSLPARVIMLDSQEAHWEQVTIRSINEPFRITSIETECIECDYKVSEKPTFIAQIKVKKKNNNIPTDKNCISVYLEHPTITKLDIPVLFLSSSI
ncbi:DUF1573 domain-containing protein [bacterium]|nr:DUF1573 domain-containing protein [bacterium]